MMPSRSSRTTRACMCATTIPNRQSCRLMRENDGLNPRTNVLGVGISLINMDIALDRLDRWVAERARDYVTICTVHTVMDCRRDERLRQIVNAGGMTTPDGMPLVWLSRLARHRYVSRVYGPDLMLAEMAASQANGHRHFFFGGQEGVADRLAGNMRQRFPGGS